MQEESINVLSAMNCCNVIPYLASIVLQSSPDPTVYHTLQYGVVPETVGLGGAGYVVVAEALLDVLLEVVDVLEVDDDGARVVVALDTNVPLTAATLFHVRWISKKDVFW